eukprot:4938432-Pyramimonas_sp.AAC.1
MEKDRGPARTQSMRQPVGEVLLLRNPSPPRLSSHLCNRKPTLPSIRLAKSSGWPEWQCEAHGFLPWE